LSIYENENELKLYHYESDQWVDRTEMPIDTVNNKICGNVTSLSPFALFEPKYCKGDLDTDGDGLDLHTLIDSFASRSGEGDNNGDGLVNSSDLMLFLSNFGCNDCAKRVWGGKTEPLILEISTSGPGG
jgi:hypothetical protein